MRELEKRRNEKENISPTATSAARLWLLYSWIKVAYFFFIAWHWTKCDSSSVNWKANEISVHVSCTYLQCFLFYFYFVEMWNEKKNKDQRNSNETDQEKKNQIEIIKQTNWKEKKKSKIRKKKREFPGGKRKTSNKEKAKCSNGPINHFDR